MGAEPYWYYVPYETNVAEALQRLRQKEFSAGRYFPAMSYEELVDLFPPGPQSPCPGPRHATIVDAVADGEVACSMRTYIGGQSRRVRRDAPFGGIQMVGKE